MTTSSLLNSLLKINFNGHEPLKLIFRRLFNKEEVAVVTAVEGSVDVMVAVVVMGSVEMVVVAMVVESVEVMTAVVVVVGFLEVG